MADRPWKEEIARSARLGAIVFFVTAGLSAALIVSDQFRRRDTQKQDVEEGILKRSRRHFARKLSVSPGTVLNLTTDQYVAGGFWAPVEPSQVWQREAIISIQSEPITWRVRLLGTTATVLRLSRDIVNDLQGDVFSVERTVSGGLLLQSQRQVPGESPQVITIDPERGSFVYSSQHATIDYNRANVYYGSCRPE